MLIEYTHQMEPVEVSDNELVKRARDHFAKGELEDANICMGYIDDPSTIEGASKFQKQINDASDERAIQTAESLRQSDPSYAIAVMSIVRDRNTEEFSKQLTEVTKAFQEAGPEVLKNSRIIFSGLEGENFDVSVYRENLKHLVRSLTPSPKALLPN